MIFENCSGKSLVALATLFSYILSEGLSNNDVNTLASFFTAVGSNLFLIAAVNQSLLSESSNDPDNSSTGKSSSDSSDTDSSSPGSSDDTCANANTAYNKTATHNKSIRDIVLGRTEDEDSQIRSSGDNRDGT
jgi:hypothetical protein